MTRKSRRRPAAACLAAWFVASAFSPLAAQTRIAPVEGLSTAVAPSAAAASAGASAPRTAPVVLGASILVGTIPSLPASVLAQAPLAAPVSATAARPAVAPAVPVPVARRAHAASSRVESASPRVQDESVAQPVASEEPATVLHPGNAREAKALATVAEGVAAWGAARAPQSFQASAVRAAASKGAAPLERAAAEPSAERAEPPSAPASADSRSRPRAAKAALISGVVLVGAAAATFAVPALVPASLALFKGGALWAGFGLMSLSRFWRAPGAGAESPRGPPAAAPATGRLAALKDAWTAAKAGADAQAGREARVGGSSLKSWRDWFIGGLRAAVTWIPLAMALMIGGAMAAKPFARFVDPATAKMPIPFETVGAPLGNHLLGYVASNLAYQAVSLAVFDGARALAARLGAGRAAPFIAGAAALSVSAALILTTVTTMPASVGPLLAIEAAALWLRVRSDSWLAPLAMRAVFTFFSLDAARLSVWLFTGTAMALAGLPAVWTGVAVAGMLLAGLAWSARSLRPSALIAALRRVGKSVSDFGKAWRTPSPDGAPKSPLMMLVPAALWGLVTYVVGDLIYWAVQAFEHAAEPAPAILAQLLSAPVDLVLYNFIIVGILEEFVFRRNLFKPMAAWLGRHGLTAKRAFWVAAVLSALIFSGAHYIDYGALLAKAGLADGAAASGLGGAYAFSWAGFLTRAALGVLLAWLYAASGTLLLPILAHFFADSLEGLGLRFGFGSFLAMGAAVLLAQLAWKHLRERANLLHSRR